MKSSVRAKWLQRVKLAIAAFLVVNLAAFAWLFIYPSLKSRSQFAVNASPLIHTYDLFDLGVVDADGDNNLDIFTVNHSAQQDFLISDGTGGYQDHLAEWNLSQDYAVPGLEDSPFSPQFEAPGLYIYRQNFLLHLQTYQVDPKTAIAGEFSLSLPVTIQSQTSSVEAQIQSEPLPSGAAATTVSFSLQGEAHIIFEDFPEIPHTFTLNTNTPLSSIYLGTEKVHPEQQPFVLMWRDRHSMAWSDVNNDGKKDVFMGRGGVKGKISQLPETLSDEMFVQTQTGFEEDINQFGLTKEGCPGRQSTWVDYNGDDLLDLYLSCGRASADSSNYPDKLYRRRPDNSFIEVAKTAGLDIPTAGYAYWIDIDSDQDQDLLNVQGDQLILYRQQSERFEPQPVKDISAKEIIKLAIADFDRDGDFDAYTVVKGGPNQILLNENGQLIVQPATDYGLPEEGLEADWIDYDNDGQLDLHVVPSGLYRQGSNNTFVQTQLLDLQRPIFTTWNARSVWFDSDNDGDRDLLTAYQQRPSVLQPQPSFWQRLQNQIGKHDTARIWQSKFYQNRGNQNHWLQVHLIGSAMNREAIGSEIRLETETGIQLQKVGGAEGSHYSQGDYRAYFGVGSVTEIKQITIQWPDNSIQVLNNVAADQLLAIQKS
ncbi:MAG: CRTAC1 family protein [Cyanobacteria bacterium J06649_4]